VIGAHIRPKFGGVIERIYRSRSALRIAGLALLAAGAVVAIVTGATAGLAVLGTGALVLIPAQPQLLGHLRSRRMRRLAPRNGHGAGVEPDLLEESRPPAD
jgi:hypothetical protein